MNLKVGGERGWCEWLCVFILGGSASWEQCWSGVRPNWLANYRCLFWLCLYVSHCSAWMREQSPGRSNETLRFIGSARRPPIRNNWAPSESSQGGILIQQFKGMKFRALSSASGRELPKILVNINAFFFFWDKVAQDQFQTSCSTQRPRSRRRWSHVYISQTKLKTSSHTALL